MPEVPRSEPDPYTAAGVTPETKSLAQGIWDYFFGPKTIEPAEAALPRMDLKAPPEGMVHWPLGEERRTAATYGDPIEGFLKGGRMRRMTSLEVIQQHNVAPEVTGGKGEPATAEYQRAMSQAWIASQRSAISKLGFSPEFTSVTPGQAMLSIGGMHDPRTSEMWFEGASPESLVHESFHRGIQRLRSEGVLPRNVGLYGEEEVVRGLMQKHHGEIEFPEGEKSQLRAGQRILKYHPEVLDEVEVAAMKVLGKKRGPR